jgi:hypothetical protein
MRPHVVSTLLVAATGLLGASTSPADYVVDQSQPLEDGYIFFARPDLAQSFMQYADNIVGAELKISDRIGSGVGDITIELWDRLPPDGGTMLATGTDYGVEPGEWATVFWDIEYITPETTYYLVLETTNDSFGIGSQTGDPYSRGMMFAMPGYQPYPDFDYTFQTFAIPEPATLGLLALALLTALRRRG